MVEIMPANTNEIIGDPEAYINFLMQGDSVEGAVSSEISLYSQILNQWRKGIISNDEAIEQAKEISQGRQANYH